MDDFALWATACETALWPAGALWSAYHSNRDEALEGVIEADPVAGASEFFHSTEEAQLLSEAFGRQRRERRIPEKPSVEFTNGRSRG